MVGYTELKNSSATPWGTYANSSMKIMLNEPPRTALEEVADARILEPFSSSIDPLFHSTIPCCIHLGRCSYASFSLPSSSLAVASLLARMATFTLGLNNTKCKRYEITVVDLPLCLGSFAMTNLFLCILLMISFWKSYMSKGTSPSSTFTI